MEYQRPGRGTAAANDIIVAVPVELKSAAQAMAELIEFVGGSMRSARGGAGVAYDEIEREVQEKLLAVERASHECMLGSLEVDARRVEIGGKHLHVHLERRWQRRVCFRALVGRWAKLTVSADAAPRGSAATPVVAAV